MTKRKIERKDSYLDMIEIFMYRFQKKKLIFSNLRRTKKKVAHLLFLKKNLFLFYF